MLAAFWWGTRGGALWLDQAKLLDEAAVEALRELVRRASASHQNVRDAERELMLALGGQHGFDNISRDSAGPDSRRQFIGAYRKDFGDFLRAFTVVRRLYEQRGQRLHSGVPLRLEIDRFLHHVQVKEVQGDSHNDRPLLGECDIEALVIAKIADYHREGEDLSETLRRHRTLTSVLGSASAIGRAGGEELCDALECGQARGLLAKHGVSDVIETNVICYSTQMSADLADAIHHGGSDRGEEMFRFLLREVKPREVIAHGRDTCRTLGNVIGKEITGLPETNAEVICTRVSTEHFDGTVFPIQSLAPPAWNRWSKWAWDYLERVAGAVGKSTA